MSVARPVEPGRLAKELPREPQTAQAARRFIESALDSWGLTALADDADVIISELVANAVRHADGPSVTVSVHRVAAQRVRLGVADGSGIMPAMGRPRPGDLHGRGLPLVDVLSDRWGTDRHRWGKRVWAELAVPDRP